MPHLHRPSWLCRMKGTHDRDSGCPSRRCIGVVVGRGVRTVTRCPAAPDPRPISHDLGRRDGIRGKHLCEQEQMGMRLRLSRSRRWVLPYNTTPMPTELRGVRSPAGALPLCPRSGNRQSRFCCNTVDAQALRCSGRVRFVASLRSGQRLPQPLLAKPAVSPPTTDSTAAQARSAWPTPEGSGAASCSGR